MGSRIAGKKCELIFILILFLLPLRHIFVGLDLWDTGYNYANFTYMGTEHMDSMWLFATYLANVVGHFFTLLPFGGTLAGLNFYTGLFVSALAIIGYWFCTRALNLSKWIAFAGELAAICLCWCPTALLYNYLTYLLFLVGVICLYYGLVEEKPGMLVAAGICLGANVLVRFSNLPEMAMIVAVWAYDFLKWREDQKRGFFKRTLIHTLWCLLGYLGILLVLFFVVQVRYGLGAYVTGIRRLLSMTDSASDYKLKSMIMGIIGTYVEHMYWVVRIGVILVAGLVMSVAAWWLGGKIGKRSGKVIMIALSGAMLLWLYLRRFCSFEFYTYGAMQRPAVLFLMLTLFIAFVRVFCLKCRAEEKLVAGMLLIIIPITSLGSNNDVFPSMNNLFIAAPYTLWESWRFLRMTGEKKLWKMTENLFPVKCILVAFLLLCTLQFAGFGYHFVFAEATGVQTTEGRVENNEVLKGIRMSTDKAQWMTELTSYVKEKGYVGQEVILYGQIPALSFYLQMPAAFNPWSDLDSYGYEVMEAELENLGPDKPLILVENKYVTYMHSGTNLLRQQGIDENTIQKIDNDCKWKLLIEFMEDRGYREDFANEKFTVYVAE